MVVPTDKALDGLSYDPTTRRFNSTGTTSVTTAHWGFVLGCNTLYLTDRSVLDVLPKEKPLHQRIPLVEFALDSPHGQRTRGTVNLGIAYIEDTWQVATELILPATHGSTRGVSAAIRVLLFLDDFLSPLLGKSILAH